jgi:hypothetical protein
MGKYFIPNGDATNDFNELINSLKFQGIHVVDIGELESFCKSVGSHGPKWVNEVLSKDLINDKELQEAREFVNEVLK